MESKENMLSKEAVLEKYGKVPLKFDSYYKYVFSFVGTAEDGAVISYSEGGDYDDIYRHEVNADTVRTIEDEGYRFLSIRLGKTTIYQEDFTW